MGFALWKTCAMACPTGWTKKASQRVSDVVGRSLHRVSDFNHLDLSFRAVARIDQAEMHPLQSLLRRLLTTPPTCIDLIAKDAGVVQPQSYDIQGERKEEAVNSRSQRLRARGGLCWAAALL